ncbi:MAG TPA: MBOAT family protein [Steroidobacteraceae bacterium]
MLFNSFIFALLFLPITLGGFFLIARRSHGAAALWLALASLVFYGWWNPRFVTLLLASVAFNYLIGRAIARAVARGTVGALARLLTFTAIAVDLLTLGVFKYLNFFIATADSFAPSLLPLTHIVLPLGISFFTFTQIAFVVDAYRGIAREYNPIHYLLFVTYFPHLIAGPILHHKQMMPQFALAAVYRPKSANLFAGAAVFTIGLAKKVLLADSFSEYSLPVFTMAHTGVQPPFSMAWLGLLAYSLQIYFDFSGYSDMAIGLSRLFGIHLPVNFNSPYKAVNIVDFWRRWHMTLSQFLRDYLYVPLGGNRHGKLRRYINLMVTMLLGGLWHGANWTFVIWGGLHGAYLIVVHAWQAVRTRIGITGDGNSVSGTAFAKLLTFLAVAMAWVFFRAESFGAASRMLRAMFDSAPDSLWQDLRHNLVPPDSPAYIIALFTAGILIVSTFPNAQELSARLEQPPRALRVVGIGALIVVVLLLVAIDESRGVSEFIYFNF